MKNIAAMRFQFLNVSSFKMLQCFKYFGRVLQYVVGHDESFGVKYVLARQRFGDAHFGHMAVFRIVSDGNVSNFALVHFQRVANR